MGRLTYAKVLQALEKLGTGEERVFSLEEVETQLAENFGDGTRPFRPSLILLLTEAVAVGHSIADAREPHTRYAITTWGTEWLKRYGPR